MKQFLIQIGYENSSNAIKLSRSVPNKFQREYMEKKLRKKREDNKFVQRVELLQSYFTKSRMNENIQNLKKIKEIKSWKVDTFDAR